MQDRIRWKKRSLKVGSYFQPHFCAATIYIRISTSCSSAFRKTALWGWAAPKAPLAPVNFLVTAEWFRVLATRRASGKQCISLLTRTELRKLDSSASYSRSHDTSSFATLAIPPLSKDKFVAWSRSLVLLNQKISECNNSLIPKNVFQSHTTKTAEF